MRTEPGHGNISYSSSQELKQWIMEATPSLAQRFIERGDTDLPVWFVPLARDVMVASPHLLRQAGFVSGLPMPGSWHTSSSECTRTLDGLTLAVERYGSLWTIQRRHEHQAKARSEVLVCRVGSMPIVAEDAQAAAHVAMHCHKTKIRNLEWIPICPFNLEAALAILEQRCTEEHG
jgi:hypothetical protein